MKRDERIALRIAPAEVKALRALAAHECRTMSETVRELIRAASKERGLWSPGESMPGPGRQQRGVSHAAAPN